VIVMAIPEADFDLQLRWSCQTQRYGTKRRVCQPCTVVPIMFFTSLEGWFLHTPGKALYSGQPLLVDEPKNYISQLRVVTGCRDIR
jgi:hypothetical protein